jgi:hypothetical protein
LLAYRWSAQGSAQPPQSALYLIMEQRRLLAPVSLAATWEKGKTWASETIRGERGFEFAKVITSWRGRPEVVMPQKVSSRTR